MEITGAQGSNIQKAQEIIEANGGKCILLLTVEDVQTVRPELSDEAAMEVLELYYRKGEFEWTSAIACYADAIEYDKLAVASGRQLPAICKAARSASKGRQNSASFLQGRR